MELTYHTTDTPLAAALITAGHELKDVELQKDGRVRYIFSNKNITSDIQAYVGDEMRLNPRSLEYNRKLLARYARELADQRGNR